MNLTDMGNAERLIQRFGSGIRYCPQSGVWYVWREARWEADTTGEVQRMAKDVARGMEQEAVDEGLGTEARLRYFKWGLTSESEPRIRAMVNLARTEPGMSIPTDQWDREPWVVNAANGTLDLASGEFRRHSRRDFITKSLATGYVENAVSVAWLEFVHQVIPSGDLREFVQRAVGYSLTADTREEVMFFLYGGGANGKSTFVNTVLAMMGDYADQCNPKALLVQRGDGPRNDLARLKGLRLVSASEATDEAAFDIDLIKRLTGDDRIVARFLHKEEFTFSPTFKIWFMANQRPSIPTVDHATWRRVRMIPFEVQIPEADRDPKVKYLLSHAGSEWPGVLNWALDGLRAWQREGLKPPAEVVSATMRYRRDMDSIGAFIEERCVVGVEARVLVGDLYKAYKGYCAANAEIPLGKGRFGVKLVDKGEGGIVQRKMSNGWCWLGIRLLEPGERGCVGLKPQHFAEGE